MVAQGIIEPIDSSEWVSPLVIVSRKNGKLRLCVDFRKVNEAVVADCYPVPVIYDLLSKFAGQKFFSKIDLKNAYYQLELHPESRDLTAFITDEGLIRFKRVPFGLSSAPSVFQKMISSILRLRRIPR